MVHFFPICTVILVPFCHGFAWRDDLDIPYGYSIGVNEMKAWYVPVCTDLMFAIPHRPPSIHPVGHPYGQLDAV